MDYKKYNSQRGREVKTMKNKKKMLVLVLLLFVAVGFAGYGVYSYYYTQGSFDTESAGGSEDADNVVRITGSFKPSTNGSIGSSGITGMDGVNGFFNEGGMVYLTCPQDVSFGTTTCTGEITVYNEGSTEINVDYYDATSGASSSDFYVTADSPSFYWSSGDGYISAGSSSTLHFSVDVNISSSADSSEEAQLVTDPVSSSNVDAYVRFKLSATQSN